MELHAVHRRAVVAHRHHHAVLAPRIGDQRGLRLADAERVVAGRGEGRGEALEQAGAVMADGGDLAVHRGHAADLLPAGQRDRLVAEAHAEQGAGGLDAGGGQLDRDSGILGAARAGRDQEAVERSGQRLARRYRVVAADGDLGAGDAQIIDQGEGEAVVIVDREDVRRRPSAPAAVRSACALASIAFVVALDAEVGLDRAGHLLGIFARHRLLEFGLGAGDEAGLSSALPGMILLSLTMTKPRPCGSAIIRLPPCGRANIRLSAGGTLPCICASCMRRMAALLGGGRRDAGGGGWRPCRVIPLATLAAMAVATARALARAWRILPVGDDAVADLASGAGAAAITWSTPTSA